uniref:Tail terminator n=1 Tax=Streptomyces phage Kamino TaxID=3158857 RepID=A0AAU7GZR4_9CAUD
MTTLHTVPDLDALPEGAIIEDNEGDGGVSLGNGTFEVVGFRDPVYSSFFAFPVQLVSPPNPCAEVTTREQSLRTIAELDALPNGSVIVGVDAVPPTFFKQAGHWINPTKRIGTTQNVQAFVHARRWGFRVAHRPA